jgi:signal transduction histidine kinase
MPKLSLARKLTLAFLLVAVTAALLVAVFIRLANAGQFNQLVMDQQRTAFQTTLESYYQTNGSWDGVLQYLTTSRNLGGTAEPATPQPDAGNAGGTALPATPQPDAGNGYGRGFGGRGPGGPGGPGGDRGLFFGLVDSHGTVVIPQPNLPLGSSVAATRLAQGTPVTVNGQVVGTILNPPSPPGLTPEETAYLQRTDLALLLAAGAALLVALLVGVLLARTLTRPLQALTQATQRLASGELGQEVTVHSSDEIGELAAAFNQMSRELARAIQVRRQMTADIAHELRTPLTVIAGYIESMSDGVLAPTPERLAVIYSEIEHLQHLVGDLRTISQADAGELSLHKQPVAVQDLMEHAQAAFEHNAEQKGIALDVQPGGDTPPVVVDEIRMTQVLSNLLSNALRYTPPGGHITLGAEANAGGVDLSVRDTGTGIPAVDLPFVFNRFYRADKSRSDEGESGLGLAIVKALVEAHGGTIEALSELGRGTTMRIHLPAATPQILG